jgi:hypothetical protein
MTHDLFHGLLPFAALGLTHGAARRRLHLPQVRTARPAYARARPAPWRRRPAEIKELKTLPIDVEARMQRRAVKRQSKALTDEDSDEEWAGTIVSTHA